MCKWPESMLLLLLDKEWVLFKTALSILIDSLPKEMSQKQSSEVLCQTFFVKARVFSSMDFCIFNLQQPPWPCLIQFIRLVQIHYFLVLFSYYKTPQKTTEAALIQHMMKLSDFVFKLLFSYVFLLLVYSMYFP